MTTRTVLVFLLSFGLLRPAFGSGDFARLLDAYYEVYQALYPVDAAQYGDSDPRYNAVWPVEIGAVHRGKAAAMNEGYLAALDRVDRAALSESEKLSFDSLQWTLQARRDRDRHFFHLLPVNQFSSPQLTFAQFASGRSTHPFKTEKDFRDFIARAAGFSSWVDTAIANMREGVGKGIVQPRVLIERTIVQLTPLTADDPAQNILFGPLGMLPADLDAPARQKLEDDYRAAVRDVMIPAYVRLKTYLAEHYLAACRDTAGIGALPGGREAYLSAVRFQTTTNLSPEEIHEIGRAEVARIRGEMEAVRKRVGFDGDLAKFLDYVATDARFSPYRTEEEVLDGYRAIESRVMQAVPRLFSLVPKTRFEIRATEKFRAATASAEYAPGAADGSRPGIFYVPILDPARFRNIRMEDLFLHEAIPGHHFQVSLAIENQSLPRFRRFDPNNAYGEGWALYVESIGRELGMFDDPYQYFGMLLGDMYRAVRLVVDTGLHAKGWTREQALAYAAEQQGGTPNDQKHVAAIERYMAWPGQALGYKIGQLRITELRRRAEQRLGPKFSLPAFHACILDEGALPLDILSARVDRWIELRQHE